MSLYEAIGIKIVDKYDKKVKTEIWCTPKSSIYRLKIHIHWMTMFVIIPLLQNYKTKSYWKKKNKYLITYFQSCTLEALTL